MGLSGNVRQVVGKMADFDDLRRLADDEEAAEEELDEDFFSSTRVIDESGGDSLFLGMTAVERMFISIFLFMNVAVLGVALLLATGRIGG